MFICSADFWADKETFGPDHERWEALRETDSISVAELIESDVNPKEAVVLLRKFAHSSELLVDLLYQHNKPSVDIFNLSEEFLEERDGSIHSDNIVERANNILNGKTDNTMSKEAEELMFLLITYMSINRYYIRLSDEMMIRNNLFKLVLMLNKK